MEVCFIRVSNAILDNVAVRDGLDQVFLPHRSGLFEFVELNQIDASVDGHAEAFTYGHLKEGDLICELPV